MTSNTKVAPLVQDHQLHKSDSRGLRSPGRGIDFGQHWASVVLGAYLLGTLTLVVIIQIYRWGKTRFFVHQPVAPAPQQV